jgi:hypothetical protein
MLSHAAVQYRGYSQGWSNAIGTAAFCLAAADHRDHADQRSASVPDGAPAVPAAAFDKTRADVPSAAKQMLHYFSEDQ